MGGGDGVGVGLLHFLLPHMEAADAQLRSGVMLYAQRAVGGHVKMHSNRLSSLIHSHISTQTLASVCASLAVEYFCSLIKG